MQDVYKRQVDEWLKDTGWEWDKEKERKIKIIPSSLIDEDGVVQTKMCIRDRC